MLVCLGVSLSYASNEAGSSCAAYIWHCLATSDPAYAILCCLLLTFIHRMPPTHCLQERYCVLEQQAAVAHAAVAEREAQVRATTDNRRAAAAQLLQAKAR